MIRTPYFCAGCPHNTGTKIPDGSVAKSGIGCHFMVQWMDRNTAGFTQMGGEGASWIGEAPFSKHKHIFQNIGDGTYYHSGLLSVRAAIASKVNVTFKILFNDAVAMTGGQPMDGPLTPVAIAQQVHAEGAVKVAVVTDEPDKYPADTAPASLFMIKPVPLKNVADVSAVSFPTHQNDYSLMKRFAKGVVTVVLHLTALPLCRKIPISVASDELISLRVIKTTLVSTVFVRALSVFMVAAYVLAGRRPMPTAAGTKHCPRHLYPR